MAEHDAARALQRLRALAEGFRTHALEELADMQRRLGEPDGLDAARADLGPMLHRLAGSGSTFGFDALARRVRALQRALQANPLLPPTRLRADLQRAEQELRTASLPARDAEHASLHLPPGPLRPR